MKFLSNMGTIVKGIQNTAKSRSLTDKFNRNTFVTVLIRLFWIKVRMTKAFPKTAKMKICIYRGIRSIPSQSSGGGNQGTNPSCTGSYVMLPSLPFMEELSHVEKLYVEFHGVSCFNIVEDAGTSVNILLALSVVAILG